MNDPPLFEQFYRKAGIALPESFCAATLLTFSLFGPGFENGSVKEFSQNGLQGLA